MAMSVILPDTLVPVQQLASVVSQDLDHTGPGQERLYQLQTRGQHCQCAQWWGYHQQTQVTVLSPSAWYCDAGGTGQH